VAAAREAAQAEGTKNGVAQIFTDEQIKARADGQARAKAMRLDYKKRCAYFNSFLSSSSSSSSSPLL
jgi:hypothetical protein